MDELRHQYLECNEWRRDGIFNSVILDDQRMENFGWTKMEWMEVITFKWHRMFVNSDESQIVLGKTLP